MVEPCEVPGFEAHVGEEAGICVRMPKWINMPADPGLDAKLLQKELMAVHHVVDHVLEVRARFIVHAPAGVHEFEAAFLHNLPDFFFHVFILLAPPHLKKFHFDVSEFAMRILEEGFHYSTYRHADLGKLDILFGAAVVLVDSLLPSNIIMCMSDEMDVQLLIHIITSIVVHLLHFLFIFALIFWTLPISIS